MPTMTDYIDLGLRYKAAATEDLEPILDEAAQAIQADIATREQLGGFLAQAWIAGAAAASHDETIAEAARAARAIKRGIEDHAPKPSGKSR
jgi:hypothetical protein